MRIPRSIPFSAITRTDFPMNSEVARARLSSAEKGAIEQAMNDGWVSANTASGLIEEVDVSLTSKAPALESPVPRKNA